MIKYITLALALLPGAVSAQAFEGAVVDLQFQRYDDGGGFKVDSLEGTLDATWQFGRFGAQAGLVLGKEVNGIEDIDLRSYQGVALHLTADATDTLRLGAMMAADNNFDGVYLYAAEALYLAGPLRVEGRIGDSFDKGDPYGLFEVNGSYAITGPLAVRFGTHYSDFGAGSYYNTFTLGAGYTTPAGTEFYADVGRHTTDAGAGADALHGSLFNLGVRFDLGAGGSDKAFRYQPLN